MKNSPVIPKVTVKTEGYSLHSKLSNLLLGLIVFFSTTQLGLHFWPLSTLVYGIRIDYLSPTIYFLDLLIVLYLVIKRSDLVGHPTRSDLAGVLSPILLVNLLYSHNPLSTLSWSLHFLLYFMFLATLGSDLKGSAQPADSKAGRSDPKGVIVVALTFALLFQFTLSIAQVSLGHSLGGLLYYLGERSVAVGSPAVALGTFMDSVVLRAYGTFGHPNVLAGWAVVGLLILIQLSQTAIPKASKQRAVRRSDLIGIFFPLLLTSLIVFLTQSRAAALALFGFVIPLYLLKNLKARILYYSITLLLCYSLASHLLTPPRADLSFSQRLTLQGLSLSVIKSFPVFGAGAQSSISTYPTVDPSVRLLQPDHNSFALFLSWFGIFGVIAILYFVIKRSDLVGHPTRSDLAGGIRIILPVLPLLLLDHYFLTSPQGLFALLLYTQVALNYSHAQKNL